MSANDVHMADLSSSVIEFEVKRRFSGGLAIDVLENVGSTNTWVKSALATSPLGVGQAAVVAAERQTAGRGRRGKTWHSPHRGITFTIAFTVPLSADRLSGLSLLCGAAICSVLRDQGVAKAKVKWPNDILVHGAKLCGVLIEVVNAKKNRTTVVVGVGVNFQRGEESRFIDQESIDLIELCGQQAPDRSVLIGTLAGEILAVGAEDIPGEVSRLAEHWQGIDALHNLPVECEGEGGGRFVGRAAGIDATGQLLVSTGERLRAVASGSVKVLKQ